MRVNPEQGAQFAQMLVQDEEPLADINQVWFCPFGQSIISSSTVSLVLLCGTTACSMLFARLDIDGEHRSENLFFLVVPPYIVLHLLNL